MMKLKLAQLVNNTHTHTQRETQTLLPYGEGVEGELRVLEQAGDEHDDLEVPSLQAQHDGGRCRELEEGAEAREGLRGESRPGVPAPGAGDDVPELGRDDDPPAEAEHERGPQQAQAQPVDGDPAEPQVQRQRGHGDVGAGRHDALRLQELLDGEVGRVREDLRDEPVDEDGGGPGDALRLAQEDQDALREGVDHGQRHGGGHEQHRRALQVHPQHAVLVRPVRLPAQRLHRAAHAQLHPSPIRPRPTIRDGPPKKKSNLRLPSARAT
jgi:hypothetical protein